MNARRHGRVFGTALLAILIACGSAWAQATATISGTVRDQSGAVLPGVTVTATQTDTGFVRNGVTDDSGNYKIKDVPDGGYTLVVWHEGAKNQSKPVTVAGDGKADFTLTK